MNENKPMNKKKMRKHLNTKMIIILRKNKGLLLFIMLMFNVISAILKSDMINKMIDLSLQTYLFLFYWNIYLND